MSELGIEQGNELAPLSSDSDDSPIEKIDGGVVVIESVNDAEVSVPWRTC
jgi:hypothetical protein